MGKTAVSWTIIAFCILIVGCYNNRESDSPSSPLPSTHKEDRISEAPPNMVRARLNETDFNNQDSEFLLTLSNSTEKNITLFVSTREHCYSATFWLFADTELGWKPIPPLSSFKCFPSLTKDLWIQIPSGLEKEFNLGFLLGSRGLSSIESTTFQMKVRYLSQTEDELFIYTDHFQIGSSNQSFEPRITVQLKSNSVDFSLENHWDQTIWLSLLCNSISLSSGWMDEEVSNLQRLTEEGSWSPVGVETNSCPEVTDLIEVRQGESYFLETTKWLEDANIALQSGTYRWDIVYYLNRTTHGVEEGRHTFTDTFIYAN